MDATENGEQDSVAAFRARLDAERVESRKHQCRMIWVWLSCTIVCIWGALMTILYGVFSMRGHAVTFIDAAAFFSVLFVLVVGVFFFLWLMETE